MGKDNKPGTGVNCRCHSEKFQKAGYVRISNEHVMKLERCAKELNKHLQLINLPLDAGAVLQLLLNQHLDRITKELLEFAALKSAQSGQQVAPTNITFKIDENPKKIH